MENANIWHSTPAMHTCQPSNCMHNGHFIDINVKAPSTHVK